MSDPAEVIRDNLARIRERIAEAAQRAGREPSEITLVGVSKYVDAAMTRLLLDAGCADLGESRPQQLWQKAEDAAFADAEPRWHMIGHLQRNKVARTLPLVTLTHGVDSERLLTAIGNAASPEQPARVLLEVNTSGDAEKHGFAADQVRDLASRLEAFANSRVCGLMTMAAREGGETVARQNFADLRDLRDELQPQLPGLAELSMGMSGDYEAAIAEGATIVRIGSVLWEGIAGE
ncbi:MAG: YggS family pyridoxal phosphate-dependent enzyme [Planctomycetota bacterium]